MDVLSELELSEYIDSPVQYISTSWPPERTPGRQRIVFTSIPEVVDVEYISPAVVDLWFIQGTRRKRVRWINRTFPFLPVCGPDVYASLTDRADDTLRAAGMMEEIF